MKLFKPVLFLLLAAVLVMAQAGLFPSAATAQEGYPLDGTWRGTWGKPGAEGTLAVVVMNWDGHAINGRINPGRNTINFTDATLDPVNWIVHFEAMTKDGQPIAIDGKLEDIGSYNRTITGTWTIAGDVNQITLTRE